MNLRDCRTLDELEQFVNAEYLYGLTWCNEVFRTYPNLEGVNFEIDKNPLRFKLHIEGAHTILYDVYTTLEEANQASYKARMEALKSQRNSLIEERNNINNKIRKLEEEMKHETIRL